MPSAKSHWPRSFRGRLLLVYVAGMLLSGGLVMAVVMVLLEPLERYMLQHSVIERAESIARIIRFDGAGLPLGPDRSHIDEWPFASLSEEVVLRIVDPHGAVFYTTDGKTFPLAPDGVGFDPQRKGFALQRDGVAMHAATVPLQRPDRLWYVQFAISDRIVLLLQHSIGLPALRKGIVATCLTFLVIFVIAMHLTLRRVLKPLRIASLQAQRITPQSLGDRLALGDLPSELVPLVDAFNRALDRVQLGFQTQQEFLANAAHELKTPLSLIRAQVELGGHSGGKDGGSGHSRYLLQDIDRMARQVQQLLHLAEASEQRNYRIERCDPRSAILEASDFMDRVAERSQVQIALLFDEGVGPWDADRGALFTLLKNLLENAIQHSPPHRVVRLQVHGRGFVVSDEGPGVAPEHLGKLFERFWRGASRRDEGAGLGLSICQEIVAAHGWTIEARNGAVGLEVRVTHASAPGPGQ
ncbi:HAMP domain-containing histidine kinase [Acidovorax sp. SUPP950]|uniref:sensor histidine kinase n=1 Tax=Acidovorax sp. SUPP950 TaxID=511901 RepID=UPI0023BBAF88|nr:ATP-binding protein [Acidovorax sp. SUPP950]GKS74268.1 HAMP domain-containing histidine kinase [Acidovorax sp. SUPP950]